MSMQRKSLRTIQLATMLPFVWSSSAIWAQQPATSPGASGPQQPVPGATAPAPAVPAPTPTTPAAPAPPGVTPTPPSVASPAAAALPPSVVPPQVASPPVAPPVLSPPPPPATLFPPRRPPARKVRPLQTTIGLDASTPDLGAEADLISAAGEAPLRPTYSRRWKYSVRAYAYVPVVVGSGPRNDGQAGSELHSSARIPGDRPNTWNYSGLTHPMNAQLSLSAENSDVAGHIFLESAASTNASYADLQALGGISDAYLTMKFPTLLNQYGGAAVNVGVFSHRYGAAGPWQNSTGYYRTSIFGKLQVAGETLVLDTYVNDELEVVFEHGFGAKFEEIVFTNSSHNPPAPMVPFLQYQGPVPQGSNFVHHAHLALILKDRLRIAAHYMTSWTPNDWRDYGETAYISASLRAPEGRLTVFGGEVHLDSDVFGNGYLGYSHVTATHVLPLSNGLSLLNSDFGYDIINNYFGGVPASLVTPAQFAAVVDSGSIDTLLLQYIVRLAPLLGLPPRTGRDLALAVFSMANVAESAKGTTTKLKFGAELEANLLRFLAVGVRYDRVAPDVHDASTTYSAISPRIVLRSRWLSREYFLLGYSHFFYGSAAYTGKPFPYNGVPQGQPQIPRPDPDVFMLSTVVSF